MKLMRCVAFFLFLLLACAPNFSAASPANLSKSKPKPETLLKEKSLNKVMQNQGTVTNAFWDDEDFEFVSSALVLAPLYFTRPKVVDPSFYRTLTSAIKKLEYDPKTKVAEIVGEAGGLKLHSWVHIDDRLWDEIKMDVIRGDLNGMEIKTYLWDKNGKTLIIGKGRLNDCKRGFSAVVSKIFPIVAEGVIDVATNNFRDKIKDVYQKNKIKTH